MRVSRRFAISFLFGAAGAGLLAPPALAQQRQRPAAKAPPPVVVLDPGHGGRDPGALGRLGTEEKDVTLAICQQIRSQLGGRGVRVVLTREGDEFLPLRARIDVAHRAHADLFISVHADAAPSAAARGLSAYTLSDKASDAFAGAIATRENAVDMIYGVDLRGTDKETAAILLDLARRHSHNASLTAKRRIIEGVGDKLTLLDNPMRSANFAVLKSATVPSVLVETGFLTNPSDEKILRDPRGRARIARLLADEIAGVAVEFKRA